MEDFREIEIDIEGATETIYWGRVSDTIYRCEESTLFSETITYGCTIEVKEIDKKLKFVRIIRDSPFHTFRYLWSKEIIASESCSAMKAKIIELEGYWEVMMGGIFIIHLPKEKEDQIDYLFEILNGRSE